MKRYGPLNAAPYIKLLCVQLSARFCMGHVRIRDALAVDPIPHNKTLTIELLTDFCSPALRRRQDSRVDDDVDGIVVAVVVDV